jgi:peptidoglycan/LPS O-acetylase OafA/YrhL
MTRLAAIMAPDRNCFGELRLFLALSVIITHSFYLVTGIAGAQPLFEITGKSLGQHAVEAFFVVSGLLVTSSLDRASTVHGFLLARLLRVVPALAAFVLVMALVIGPIVSSNTLAAYFTSRETFLYIVKTISMSTGHATLPGVFQNLPVAGDINIPIYTLKYELFCYFLLAGAGAIGLFRNKLLMTGALGLVALAFIGLELFAGPEYTGSRSLIPRFMFCFALGSAAYIWRDRVPLHIGLVAIFGFALWLGFDSKLHTPLLSLFTAALILWLAKFPIASMAGLGSELDLSYGIYVWGWPIQQSLMWAVPGVSIGQHIMLSIMVLTPIAYLSWTRIEAPAQRLKAKVMGRPPRTAAAAKLAEPIGPLRGRHELVP